MEKFEVYFVAFINAERDQYSDYKRMLMSLTLQIYGIG